MSPNYVTTLKRSAREREREKKRVRKRYGHTSILCFKFLLYFYLFYKWKAFVVILVNCWFIIVEGFKSTNKKVKSKVSDHSWGWPKGSLFDSFLHQCVGEGATPFPGLLYFTLDSYLIMLSVKQGGIKYHFLSLWYDSTWDRTQVSRAIGEHSNRQANVQYESTNNSIKIVCFFTCLPYSLLNHFLWIFLHFIKSLKCYRHLWELPWTPIWYNKYHYNIL